MAAIVTDSLKRILTNLLLTEISSTSDTNEYYIGIGKSDEYNETDTPTSLLRTIRSEREVRDNIQSVKKVASSSFVVPRYNWTSGTTYTGYNDNVVGIPTNPYYVLTENNDVYICLQQGKNALGQAVPSTVLPSYSTAGVNQIQAFQTSDGYRWKFLFQISAARANSFLSANYLPVQFLDDSSGAYTGLERDQALVKEAATPGQILGVTLTSGGSSYTSAPTVTINGNGSSAAATATVSGGAVVKIEMNNESAGLGSGYDHADIVISGGGGTGATARPIIGPLDGIGADIRNDLKASTIMLNAKPDGSESGAFVLGNDFRQIAVMRNITLPDSDTLLTSLTARGLKYHRMTAPATSFTVDKFIRGAVSGAGAFIDEIDSDYIYYHQNENTGFKSFQNGETLGESDGSGSGLIDSAGLSTSFDPYSGEVLYIENRARIVRDALQTEDIKVVITI